MNIHYTPEELDRLPDVQSVGIKEAAAIARCSTKKQFRLLVNAGIFALDATKSRWHPVDILNAAGAAMIRPDNIGSTEVYFIETGPFVKIGYSTFSLSRLDALQAATPYELRLIGAIKGSLRDEERLHLKFSHLRHRGEWFNKSPELMAYIEWLLAQT